MAKAPLERVKSHGAKLTEFISFRETENNGTRLRIFAAALGIKENNNAARIVFRIGLSAAEILTEEGAL